MSSLSVLTCATWLLTWCHAVTFFFSFTVVNENVSLVISRQLLTDFCTHLPNLPDATAKAVYHFTLEKIQPRVISFEEQVNTFSPLSLKLQYSGLILQLRLDVHSQVASIRQHLATIYEKEGDWRNAAQVLVGIPLETGQKWAKILVCFYSYLQECDIDVLLYLLFPSPGNTMLIIS